MLKYRVNRMKDTVLVSLMPHKDRSGYSFVNLTKGHICPCVFDTIEEALKDMDEDSNVISYERINDECCWR